MCLDFHAATCSEEIGRQMRCFYNAKATNFKSMEFGADPSLRGEAASLLVNQLIAVEEENLEDTMLFTSEHAPTPRSSRSCSKNQWVPSSFVLLSSLQPVPTIDLVLFRVDRSSLLRFIWTCLIAIYSLAGTAGIRARV